MKVKINITIPDELYNRIQKYKKGVLEINISKICTESIKKELDKLDKND
jgi:post-segregation antitoxin (ccd killing protein)